MGCGDSGPVQRSVKPFNCDNALPLIIHSQRVIPDGSHQNFNDGYLPAVQYLFDNVPGTKAVFYAKDE